MAGAHVSHTVQGMSRSIPIWAAPYHCTGSTQQMQQCRDAPAQLDDRRVKHCTPHLCRASDSGQGIKHWIILKENNNSWERHGRGLPCTQWPLSQCYQGKALWPLGKNLQAQKMTVLTYCHLCLKTMLVTSEITDFHVQFQPKAGVVQWFLCNHICSYSRANAKLFIAT